MADKGFYNLHDMSQGIARELAEGITTRIFPGEQAMLSVVRLAPNAEGTMHSHPQEQWGAMLEGSATRIQNGEAFEVKTGDFWRMFQYWDPGRGEAVVIQFGFSGAVGLGRAWAEDGLNKSAQTFYGPDGGVSGVGHEATNPDADTHLTHSFDIVDEVWNPRRAYTWKRDKTTTEEKS